MKIHRIYNGLNELEDISGDKVQIELSVSMWQMVKEVIDNSQFGFNQINNKRLAQRVARVIEEAEKQQTTEWTK